MIYIFLVMILVTVAIIVILLQTKSTTITTQNPQTATTSLAQKTNSEKKYVESLNVLAKITDTQRPSPHKPRLSLTLNNLLVDDSNRIINSQWKEYIAKLSQAFDLHIILKGTKDENSQSQQNALLDQFKGLVQSHKVILCHTEEGMIAIIRQIKPRFHFENNEFVVERLSQHLNHILGTNQLKENILENSKNNTKLANILNHNIDFFDNFDQMCSHVLNLTKFN